MFDLPFDSIKDLFKQAFLYRNYRKMNPILAILFIIITSPFFLTSLVFLVFYEILIFIFNFLKSPADYLLNYLKDVGKDVKHATQAVVFLVGFPFVFLLTSIMALIVVPIFIIYFFINVFTYFWTLGDIKFNAYITKKVERDFAVVSEPKYKIFPLIIFAIFAYGFLSTSIGLLASTHNSPTLYGGTNVYQVVGYVFLALYLLLFTVCKFALRESNHNKVIKQNSESGESKAHQKNTIVDYSFSFVILISSILTFAVSFSESIVLNEIKYRCYFNSPSILGLLISVAIIAFFGCIYIFFFKKRLPVSIAKYDFIIWAVTGTFEIVAVGMIIGKLVAVIKGTSSWFFEAPYFIMMIFAFVTILASLSYVAYKIVKFFK